MTDHQTNTTRPDGPMWLLRSAFGGVLMGLANLVPGISGGTMLLAAGIYPQFIGAVAEVTTFRFRLRTLLLLATVIGAALAAIIGLAGPVRDLVVNHCWIMYSLFIGLTLSGVPVIWRMLKRITPTVALMTLLGIAAMVVMVLLRPSEAAQAADGSHPYVSPADTCCWCWGNTSQSSQPSHWPRTAPGPATGQ